MIQAGLILWLLYKFNAPIVILTLGYVNMAIKTFWFVIEWLLD